MDEDSYLTLSRIADKYEVSVSWLARYAIGGFLKQCRRGAKIELTMTKQDEEQ